jgi:hypothetical protein
MADLGTHKLTRRSFLQRAGRIGLVAAAAGGIAELLGTSSASATASHFRSSSAGLSIGQITTAPDGILTAYAPGASPDCCTECYNAEGDCGVEHCPDEGCCFYCDGCGLDGYYCIEHISCSNSQINYCP